MKQQLKKYEKNLKLAYFPSIHDKEKNIYYGGIPTPKYLSELSVFVGKSNNKKPFQIHIKGSKKALAELGKYFISMSDFQTSDPDYHDHFDEMDQLQGNTEVIIHHHKSNWLS